MKNKSVVCLSLSMALPLFAIDVLKQNNTDPLNAGSSWLSGVAPTAADVAVWSNNVTAANSSALTNAAAWNGIKVTNPGGPVTIGGSATLTLGGAAPTDIDLTSASQDLTVQAPVILTSTSPFINVNAGRTLLFTNAVGVNAATDWQKYGNGTLVFDGPVTSGVQNTMVLFNGTTVLTGKSGGLSFTSATTSGGRFYVGRGAGSDALLIVSNGTHVVKGISATDTANFIGASFGHGRLIVEGGSLSAVYLRIGINGGPASGLPNEVTVNSGVLDVTGSGSGINNYALMIGNSHDDSATVYTNSGTLTINGGLVTVTNGLVKLGFSNNASLGTQTVNLNGGVLAVRQFYLDAATNVAKVFNFNGGTLQVVASGALFTGTGVMQTNVFLNVRTNGLVVSVSGANDTVIAAPLRAAGGAGGLNKLGSGSLTLGGANTYTGKSRVLAGTLRISGNATATHPDLSVASSAGLSLRDGTLATFSPAALVLGSTNSAASLELELAATGSACDVLAVPSGASVGRVAFSPVVQGTTTRAARAGDYVVMTYAGSAPDVSGFTVPSPATDRIYSFILDTGAKTVTLRIAYGTSESVWTATGSGDWQTAGNWSTPPANAAGARARLDTSITAPATVTATSPVTFGALVFANTNAYTLAGSAFTFDNGTVLPLLTSELGMNAVTAPLTLAGDLQVKPALNTQLKLTGVIGGPRGLVKDDAGELWLTAANTYAGGTRLKLGSVILSDSAALGSGTVSAEGGSGFRIVSTTAIAITNPLVMSVGMNFNALENNVTVSGPVDWQTPSIAIAKTGPYELRLGGTASETVWSKFTLDDGTLRFLNGSVFALQSTAFRDAISMVNDTGKSRSVVIDAGAQVTLAGFEMAYGVSNTVSVQGGKLTLLGGLNNGNMEACLMRSNGTGLDRFIVESGEVNGAPNAYFSIGVRGGANAWADLIINGGTTTLGRVSLGVRLDSGAFDGRGRIDVNGGRLNVTDAFNWMGDWATGRTNYVVLGNGVPGSGVMRLPATLNTCMAATNMPVLTFNGGTLETSGLAPVGGTTLTNYLFGVKQVYVGAGGARIDTMGNDVAIAQPLQLGTVADGGLTKQGNGALTLSGAGSFLGVTTVSQGTLVIPASYASTGLVAAAGAELSMANGAIQTWTLGSASLPSGAKITFETLANGSACDRVNCPASASVGDLSLAVVQQGTTATVSHPGDYTLFAFAGSVPSISGWTLRNPPVGRTWSFTVVGSTVVLRIAYTSDVSVWTNSGSGTWETAGNWTVAPADAAGTVARLDDAISAPATVTRGSASTVGSLTFNNAQPYTLAGSTLTLANLGDAASVIAAERGVHSLSVALNLTSNALIRAADGAAVALNGGVSGSTSLTVEGPGALALPNTAGLAIGGLNFVSAGMLVVSNTATLTTPVSLGTGGGVFSPATGTALSLAATVTGAGDLTKQGSSFLMLTNANANYTGTTKVKAGTVRLDTLPGGSVELGQGTLHVTGTSVTTAGGYTLKTDSATRAAVLRADGSVTFQGRVSALSGALVKNGPGTVIFTAPGENVFNADNGAGASHAVLDIGANGDSPTTGFSAFNVVDGKVVLGAPGQTNRFNGLVVVGLNSTSIYNAETAGALEIAGGVTTMNSELIIGRSNGNTNTAPVARASKLKMTSGELSVGSLILGRALVSAGHNAAPEFEITGGLLTVTNQFYVPEQAGAVASVKLNGGTVVAPNIVRVNGQANVIFNGSVFRPSADAQTLQGMTSAKVGTGGALFDLSLVNTYTLAQTLTTDGGDGGLTKTGAGRLVISAKQFYAGPTVISAGSLRLPVTGGLSNATALTVSPGASLLLDTANVQTVPLGGLTLGASAATPVSVELSFALGGTSNDLFAVNGNVTLGNVALTLLQAGARDAFALNGTYTLMTYTGTAPDVSGLSVANPLVGKIYTFAAVSGAVTVKIEADYSGSAGAAVWKATGGGAWETAGNWSVAPGAGGVGQQVRFDASITAPANVTVSGGNVTVGTVYFNNTNAYTLSGSSALTFDNGATQALVSAESGFHAITVPMTLSNGGLTVIPALGSGVTLGGTMSGSGALAKTGGGDLTVTQPNPRTGVTSLNAGAVELSGGATLGTGVVVIDGGTGVRVIGSGAVTVANPVTLKTGLPTINTRDSNLTLSGTLDWQTGVPYFYKVGTNTLTLAGTGTSVASVTPKLLLREGGLRFASGADYTIDGATKESIKVGLTSNAKTSVTIDNGARVVLGGLSVTAEATGTVNDDCVITQNGGSIELHNTSGDGGAALSLRDNGMAPATYVMNGGTFTMPQVAWANIGNCGPGRLTVNGGSMSLGRFAAGYQNTSNAAAGGSADVAVTGGRLEATGSWSWMSDSGARSTDVRVNGGTLALPATRLYGTNVNNWTGLTLNGGTLEALGAALDSAATDNWLAGLRRLALGVGGGTFDTRGQEMTIRQNVQALSGTGGVAKVGAGVLALAGTNVLWGLADVREGVLRAKLTHRDLPGTPLVWFGMDSSTNADLSGNGFNPTVVGSGFTVTNRTATSQGLSFNGSGRFSVAHNPYFTNVTSFTVSLWLNVSFIATDSNQSLVSARAAGDKAFEFKLNAPDNALRVLEDSTGSWWQDVRTVNPVPLNQWTHAVAVVTPQGVAMYLNGVRQGLAVNNGIATQAYTNGYLFPGDIRLAPTGRASGLLIGSTSGGATGLKGALDDVMVFDRALSDTEVAQLYSGSAVRPASVRVASAGLLDLQGSSNTVSQMSGSGQVINGTLAVKERLDVGDADQQSPGAVLTMDGLTLGTNLVYACSCSGVLSDLTVVNGNLTVNGTGTVDFGRTEANQVSGSFAATVMTYGTITGGTNFTSWAVTGLGRRGYATSVKAENGQVVVTLRSLYGTLLQLK